MSLYPKFVAIEKARLACEAECNLNIFAACEAILEGGTLRGKSAHAAAAKIIKICHDEQRRQLNLYDKALSRRETEA